MTRFYQQNPWNKYKEENLSLVTLEDIDGIGDMIEWYWSMVTTLDQGMGRYYYAYMEKLSKGNLTIVGHLELR